MGPSASGKTPTSGLATALLNLLVLLLQTLLLNCFKVAHIHFSYRVDKSHTERQSRLTVSIWKQSCQVLPSNSKNLFNGIYQHSFGIKISPIPAVIPTSQCSLEAVDIDACQGPGGLFDKQLHRHCLCTSFIYTEATAPAKDMQRFPNEASSDKAGKASRFLGNM
ncbi:hypothetical protein BT96DRAFT_479697 [Gymnopus androsaceus JB14]|uniref:Uncharacterized protein n=1 Tax=Gymnopus androsaceus JB14 TaxID=1447944 RepID=A0A6A4I498_9AGAR|nr:hypothetical protein BT96DRAFT_479697 [Gymnopus androsaceus JB14]